MAGSARIGRSRFWGRRLSQDAPAYHLTVLAWMDLEMTGLDPRRHVIVEIATLITDDNLEMIAEGPDIVIGASAAELGEMDDVVRKMHTESGLLAAIEASTVTVAEAGAATLAFLRTHAPDAGRVPLCGNSIGVDRRFLDRYLPEIEQHLHYRSVDVSTVKELSRRWAPPIYGHAPRKAGNHRALDDIRESVAELAYYRETFFRIPERPSETTSETPDEPTN
jgi:oligoribonuclease